MPLTSLICFPIFALLSLAADPLSARVWNHEKSSASYITDFNVARVSYITDKMAAIGQEKQEKWPTDCPDRPVVDKLPSAESKVLESEILQLSFPRLKAIVGKENNGGVIPEKKKQRGH